MCRIYLTYVLLKRSLNELFKSEATLVAIKLILLISFNINIRNTVYAKILVVI